MTERRSSNRIPVTIDARLFLGNMFYSGTIANISGNGMLIKTGLEVSRGESFIVLLPSGEEVTKLVARVKHVIRENSILSGLGVEVVSPSREYADFIEGLESCLYI